MKRECFFDSYTQRYTPYGKSAVDTPPVLGLDDEPFESLDPGFAAFLNFLVDSNTVAASDLRDIFFKLKMVVGN